jgi:hypothetical protein
MNDTPSAGRAIKLWFSILPHPGHHARRRAPAAKSSDRAALRPVWRYHEAGEHRAAPPAQMVASAQTGMHSVRHTAHRRNTDPAASTLSCTVLRTSESGYERRTAGANRNTRSVRSLDPRRSGQAGAPDCIRGLYTTDRSSPTSRMARAHTRMGLGNSVLPFGAWFLPTRATSSGQPLWRPVEQTQTFAS